MTRSTPKNNNPGGVLRRRGKFLSIMKQMTIDRGYFTISDVAEAAGVPRSTTQDWIKRLVKEGCIFVKNKSSGRVPARYASKSAVPQTTCKRIFTVEDSFEVEIFHECLSCGCIGFCEYHHKKAGGAAIEVRHDGMFLRETAKIGTNNPLDMEHAAVGLMSVRKEGNEIVQTIRSVFGGPAYSLLSMMGHAKGVNSVEIKSADGFVTGEVRTNALIPVTIGVDDTDRKGCGGATFALSQELLEYLSESKGVIGISHHVAVLSSDIKEKTAGNSCSFIEAAVEPEVFETLSKKVTKFVDDESASDEWGVAIMKGISVPTELLMFAAKARKKRVSMDEALKIAKNNGIQTFGGRGIIGALCAVSFKNQPTEVMLDLENDVII